MKKLYERLVKNCATANDFNRLHIAIENRATPDEVHQLSELIDKHYVRTASAKWITTLRGLNDLSKKAEPEDYVRRKIGPNLFFYSNNAPTAAKTLIVGFPGGAGRLMMPVSVLLQHMAATDADLLFINHRGPSGYEDGVPRLAGDFLELIAVLSQVISKWNYKRRVAFGTSTGGLPALFAAILLKFDQGASVGSAVFDPKIWGQVLDEPAYTAALESKRNRPKLLGIYSEMNDRDRTATQGLRDSLPVIPCPIHARMHNTLWEVLTAGHLSKLLSFAVMAK